eukprot:2173-Rhodomonas_salina.3
MSSAKHPSHASNPVIPGHPAALAPNTWAPYPAMCSCDPCLACGSSVDSESRRPFLRRCALRNAALAWPQAPPHNREVTRGRNAQAKRAAPQHAQHHQDPRHRIVDTVRTRCRCAGVSEDGRGAGTSSLSEGRLTPTARDSRSSNSCQGSKGSVREVSTQPSFRASSRNPQSKHTEETPGFHPRALHHGLWFIANASQARANGT